MLAAIHDGLVGQYGAALRMLAACLKGADAAAWGAPVGKFAFWHVAYHTLFSTDLYLSPSERAFEAPRKSPAPTAAEALSISRRVNLSAGSPNRRSSTSSQAPKPGSGRSFALAG